MAGKSRPSRKRIVLYIVLALAAVWTLGGLLLPFPRCTVKNIRIASLNALAVDLEVAGQLIYMDIHYPRDSLLLCEQEDDGSGGIPYEYNYTIGTFDIGRRRSQGTYVPSPGFPLSPVQYKTESLGTRLALFGMSGEAMVRVGARPHEKPLIDMATRCFLGGRDTLATCFVPRLLVEQEINGEWTSLTQFNLVGMCYYHAPQDTVRIRITTAA